MMSTQSGEVYHYVRASYYSQLVIMVSNLFILNQLQNPSKQISIQTDLLFIYSQGDAVVSGSIKPQMLQNTCTLDESAEVFSFVQSQLELPLNEALILLNYQSQFNLNMSVPISMWDLQKYILSNFTYSIITLGSLNISQPTKIQTSRFGAYANTFRIDGNIDASGRGCNGGQGLGRGKSANKLCTATGGSHGGMGGVAATMPKGQLLYGASKNAPKRLKDVTDVCNEYQSLPYGNFDQYSALEGSGGGGLTPQLAQDAGSGGGYIWIQSQTLILTQALLNADGGPSNEGQETGVGAGAGGTIFLAMNQLFGYGNLSAVGGDASQTGGGGGSGGRVKFYFFSWFQKDMNNNMTNITDPGIITKTQGGSGGTPVQVGQEGTVWSTPCAPGYYGLFCVKCTNGTYKTEYSNIECKKCESMPLEALYSGAGEYFIFGESSPMCQYRCRSGYAPFDQNHKCLTNLQLFFDNMGGVSIFVIIVLATIFAISAIIYFLSTKNKNESIESDENLNRLRMKFEELDFVQRDVHQHICRVYLMGNNELTSPWVLPITPPVQLRNRVYLDRYEEFAKKINRADIRNIVLEVKKNIAQFFQMYQPLKNSLRINKKERCLSRLLPFLYPPLKPLYNKYKRREHYYSFKKSFIAEADKIDFWRSQQDQMNIEFRFTSSDDYTLGCLDFLDVKRTKDAFDKIPLPMTILLSGNGAFNKPFQINRHDKYLLIPQTLYLL